MNKTNNKNQCTHSDVGGNQTIEWGGYYEKETDSICFRYDEYLGIENVRCNDCGADLNDKDSYIG